jgi:hypothetical protein
MARADKDWLAIVARSRPTVAAIESGEPIPLVDAVETIAGLWRAAIQGGGDEALVPEPPLDARVQTFIAGAFKSAERTDRRWHSIGDDDRMALFLAALYLANTHSPDEITAAVRTFFARTRQTAADVLEPQRNVLWSAPRIAVTTLGAVAAAYAGGRYGYRAAAFIAVATGIASMTLP